MNIVLYAGNLYIPLLCVHGKNGTVHMEHCTECKYFEPIFWHCLYGHRK